MKKYDVVQFNENHKWCGCIGIVYEVKPLSDGNERYLVGVEVPERGTAYIYSNSNDHEIEYIGQAIMAAH